VLRKRLAGVPEDARLPPGSYRPAERKRVYDDLLRHARIVASAGHTVLLDAVFTEPATRREAETLARKIGAPFVGLWLEAEPAQMLARVGARRGDASDADAEVVRRQLAEPPAEITWTRIDASLAPEQVARSAAEALHARIPGLVQGDPLSPG
jgi:predicted kinase